MKQPASTETNQCLVAFLLLVIAAFHLVTATANCPLFCSCEHNISESMTGTSVECQHNSLSYVPVGFPKDTRDILLERNLITTIGHGQFIDLENLIVINISFNEIASIKNGAFIGLHRLETIDLRGNLLQYLADGIFENCTNVRTININRNRIHTFSNKFCPECTRLEQLYLRNNELSILTDDAFGQFQHLKVLDLRENKLTELSLEGVRFPNSIEELQLGSNIISIAANLRLHNATKLLVLGLEMNSIHDADELALENMTRLQFVNFSNNVLTRVPHSILPCRSIQTLDFSDNLISTMQDMYFANFDNVRVVYLDGNKLIDLPKCLFHNNANLTEVRLENNRLRAAFSDSFCKTDNLLKLYLQDNDISQIEIYDLPSLQILNLTNNEISEGELDNIFNLPNMSTLLLSGNNITILTENILHNLSALQELDLSNNTLISIENNAFSNVADTLKSVDISQNEIEILLSDSFNELRSLERLNLALNRIASVPRFIFSGLQKLKILNISYNSIGTIEEAAFEGLTEVSELDLRGNSINFLPAQIFSAMKILLKLYLSGNYIEEVTQDMFVGLDNLKFLSIEDNNIHSIIGQPFDALYDLLELNLRNNKLHRIKSDSFRGLSSLITLDLSGNNIHTLELNAFQHLVDVESIFLSYNKIMNIEGILLNCLGNLNELRLDHNLIQNTTGHINCAWENTRIIDLSFNHIQSISPETFTIFPKLEYLDLKSNLLEAIPEIRKGNYIRTLNISNNSITFVGDYSFGNMTDLVELDLSEMYLQEIQKDAFRGLKRLELLNLENGGLTTLKREIFDELLSIRKIQLRKNPWTCDCFLKDFLMMFSGKDKLPMLEKSQMICQSPISVYLQDALVVPANDMICKPPIVEFVSDVSVAQSGHMLTLICMANGIPEPELTWQGKLVERSNSVQTKTIQTTEGVLLISEITHAQTGEYSCTATNALGEDTGAIEIQVFSQGVNDDSENVLLVILVTAIITVMLTITITICCYLWFKHRPMRKMSRSSKYYLNRSKPELRCYENKGRDVQEDYVTIGKHYQKSGLTHDVNMDGKWKDVHKRYLSREDMIEFGQYMAERTMGYGVIRRSNSDHLYLNGQEASACGGSGLNTSISDSNIDDELWCHTLKPKVTGDYSGPTTPIPLTPVEAAFKYGYGNSLHQGDIVEKLETQLTDDEIELSMVDDFERTFTEIIQQYGDLDKISQLENSPDVIGDDNERISNTTESCTSPNTGQLHLPNNQLDSTEESGKTREPGEKELPTSVSNVLPMPGIFPAADRGLDPTDTANYKVNSTEECSSQPAIELTSHPTRDGPQCHSDSTVICVSNNSTNDNAMTSSEQRTGHSNEHYQATSDDSNSDVTSLSDNISLNVDRLDVIEAEFENSMDILDMSSQYDSDLSF